MNIQGLLNEGKQKKDELLGFARLERVGVLALQETWLSKSHKLVESKLEGYCQYKAVRPSRTREGSRVYVSHQFKVLRHEEYSNDHCSVVMTILKELIHNVFT